MTSSPIQNKIGMVFIPVSEISAAIDWYSRLFGVPMGRRWPRLTDEGGQRFLIVEGS